MFAEVCSECFGAFAICGLLVRAYGAAYADVHFRACLAEYFGGKPQGARRPAGVAEEVEPPAVAAVEVYGNHRHFGAVYYLEYRLLPRAVLEAVAERGLAHGSCREEAHRLAFLQLPERLPYSGYRNGALCRVGACRLVDSYEVGAHGADFVENHIHHHSVCRAARRYEIYQRNAVERAEGVVANGDKGSFGKIVEDVGVVDAQLDFEFFEQQAAHELRSRGVAAFSVHGVDLVDGQESQQEVCYARVAVEGGYECPEVGGNSG